MRILQTVEESDHILDQVVLIHWPELELATPSLSTMVAKWKFMWLCWAYVTSISVVKWINVIKQDMWVSLAITVMHPLLIQFVVNQLRSSQKVITRLQETVTLVNVCSLQSAQTVITWPWDTVMAINTRIGHKPDSFPQLS